VSVYAWCYVFIYECCLRVQKMGVICVFIYGIFVCVYICVLFVCLYMNVVYVFVYEC
jgi:hypothetical protein